MGIRMRVGVWAALLLLTSALAHASGVKASLDRDHVTLGDTVTLTLAFPSDSAMTTPDLTPLHKDFQVEGQSSSSSFSSVNGAIQSSYLLQLSLRPLHAGTLTIPALKVGAQHTPVLTLKVSPPSADARGKAGDAAFLTVTLNTHTPYVGEQVALDVRLFYSAALANGNLADPVVDGAEVSQLGRDQRYQTIRDGRRYFVVERHYALVPQRAGKLVMPPVMFQGEALNSSGMGGFFSNVHRVGAQSGTETLTVKPRPPATDQGPWLPARQVELNLSGLPASGQVQAGEPVTVTVQEGATGLSAADLPEPSLPGLPGADVYPDHAQDVTRNNGEWITGSRTRNFAIVPNRPGTLRIPPITLSWWNVVTDREETTRIPAHTLTVLAAGAASATPASPSSSPAGASASLSTSPLSTPSPPPGSRDHGPPGPAPDTGTNPWRRLALGSFALWLLTLILAAGWWLLARRRRARPVGPAQDAGQNARVRTLRNAFLAAARGGDLRATGHALLAWARAERPALKHLQDLAAQLRDADQRACIGMLERDLYAAHAPTGDTGDRIADAFRQGFAWRITTVTEPRDVLPPLYPRR